jgi:hypothetical protein
MGGEGSLQRYFNLFKHLCAVNVVTALAALYLYSRAADSFGLVAPLLVLSMFYASLCFAQRGMNYAIDCIATPVDRSVRTLRRRLALASVALVTGTVSLASSAVVLFVG